METFQTECQQFDDRNFKMGLELELHHADFDSLRWDESYLSCHSDVSFRWVDGSEFVTGPDSAAVHVRELGKFLARNKFWTSVVCGMHVHVDRQQLGESALSYLLDRMFDQRRKNFHSRYIFGRRPNQFCAHRRDWTGDLINGKFCIINTGGRRTVEIRWFSGCADIRKIKRRLQWVNAVCAWAKRKARAHPKPSADKEIAETVESH
jgi:hypothetical protein